MAIEQGIIVKMGSRSETAWVKTIRSSACESCSVRDSCNPGADGKSQEVEAINTAGAQLGDRIQLTIATGSVLKAMFVLYLFPILCMLAGGITGNWLGVRMQTNPSATAVAVAMVTFAVSLLIVRFWGQRAGHKEAYRPKIIRILGHEVPHNGEGQLSAGCASQVEHQQ